MFRDNKILLMIFNLFLLFPQAQEQQKAYKEETYEKISGLFNGYSENDERALVFVKMYVDKAKSENNIKRLIRGYEEAIYYSKEAPHKLSYADSTIITAKKYNDRDQISRAYLGKGIVYYYNKRQYKFALENYLIAFKFSKDSHDDYLKNKIIYHLGMVKSYLGYYKEAAGHFEQTADYFERNISDNLTRNLQLNNEAGYFNSIYRLSTCYKNLRLFSKEDSLINIGLKKLHDTKELSLEYGYFQKGKGIQLLRENKWDEALKHLNNAQEILNHGQDHASLTTVYFYLGKLYWSKGNRNESLRYLKKVDSLVNKFSFITPDIRSAYGYLINDAKGSKNSRNQRYYRNQLLKADSILNADFAKLSLKISGEYDTDILLEEKKQFEKMNHKGLNLLYFSTSVGILFLLLFGLSIWMFRDYRKRENEINIKYQELLTRFDNPKQYDSFDRTIPITHLSDKNKYSSEIIDDIKTNLKVFENKKLFLQKGLTLEDVSQIIGSNRTHVSHVLNVHMNITFSTYIKVLRIRYITNLLLEHNVYLNYNLSSLANDCGISNRQIFARYFKEINGISPMDFIKRRKEELKKNI